MDKNVVKLMSQFIGEIHNSSEEEHNSVINAMKGFMDNGKPKVGIFWYNYVDNVLFGVEKGDVELYANQGNIITYPNHHKTYWQIQHDSAISKGDISSLFYTESNYKGNYIPVVHG